MYDSNYLPRINLLCTYYIYKYTLVFCKWCIEVDIFYYVAHRQMLPIHSVWLARVYYKYILCYSTLIYNEIQLLSTDPVDIGTLNLYVYIPSFTSECYYCFYILTEADQRYLCFNTCKYILKSLRTIVDCPDRDKPNDLKLDRCCFTLFDDNINQEKKKQIEYSSWKTVHCIDNYIFYKHGSLILLESEIWYCLHIQSAIIFLPSCNIGLLVKGCKLISLRLLSWWTVGFVLYFAKEKKKKKCWILYSFLQI
jgi:hypothetical protein